MTSSVPETKRKSPQLTLGGVCLVLCVLILGVSLALPRIFHSDNFPVTVRGISIILFFINASALITASVALFTKNTGPLLAVPSFILAGTYLFSSADGVMNLIDQVQYLSQYGEQMPFLSVVFLLIGIVASLLVAAGFAVMGVLCLLHRNKNVKRFLYFVPFAVFGISLLVYSLLACGNTVNTVLAFTEEYLLAATLSILFSFCTTSACLAVFLLYTVAALLLGINFAKKQQ